MKLETHIIEAKPTQEDPMAQRGHVVLLWGEDKEVREFDSAEREDVPLATALSIASDIWLRMGGDRRLRFADAVRALLDKAEAK